MDHKYITELANTIAGEAEAIRDGKAANPVAMAALMQSNINTLAEWLKTEQAEKEMKGYLGQS